MMLHFKDAGYHQYDLGGISKLPKLRPIDEFKEAFGGQEVLEYNLLKGITFKGKLAVRIFQFQKGLGRLLKGIMS